MPNSRSKTSSSKQNARPRLLMLHPKTLTDSWPFPVDTLGEIIKAPSSVFPILAGCIRHLPIDLEIFDGYVQRETFAAYKLRLARADIIAITMMSPLKAMDTELNIRLAKRLNPNVKIILGGNHGSVFAKRWVGQGGADFVVTGEAEIAFPMLIEAILNQSDVTSVPNLVYGVNAADTLIASDGSNNVMQTSEVAPKVDLDNAPLPDWSKMNLAPYGLGLVRSGTCASIEMSRGCPFRCDFCNINTYWNHKQRTKSPERVLEELQRLHRLGVREFIFSDDNFAQDERRTAEVFEGMLKLGLKMRFGSFLRGDTVRRNPEFIELAAKAGMRFGLMGIETLDQAWLVEHSKGVRTDDVVAMYAGVYQTLKRNGIFLLGLFITPPGAAPSGQGANGVVCDFHYAADLVAQQGSTLFDSLDAQGAVAKDMFYHDWNLGSIRYDGREQGSHKTLFDGSGYDFRFALKSLFSSDRFTRRLWWRHPAIVGERLLCTSLADLERRRIARANHLTLAERQEAIVDTVLNDKVMDTLLRRKTWKSPLSLRNGLVTPRPAKSQMEESSWSASTIKGKIALRR